MKFKDECDAKASGEEVGLKNIERKGANCDSLKQEEDIIVPNPAGNSSADSCIDGLDPSVVRYIKKLLVETDGQQSVIIIDEENSEQVFQFESISGSEHGEGMRADNVNIISNSGSSITPTHPASSNSTTFLTDSKSSIKSVPRSVSKETHAVESSHGTKPTSSVYHAKADKVDRHQNVPTAKTISSPVMALTRNISSSTNHPPISSPSKSSLNHQTSDIVPSLPHCEISIQKPTPHASQAAEHLLDIAHKMISKKKQEDAKLTSELPPEVNQSSDTLTEENRHKSESVITMYLSSPSELKNKIEALKDNSPIVVLQAQSDSFPTGEYQTNDDAVGVIKANLSSPKTMKLECPEESSATLISAIGNASVVREGEEVVYRCQECGYSSHNKHYYKQHVDLVHNEDRPYKCPHCDYAGKRRHALLEHMVVHSNNRPFTCGHCNASFRKKGHLTNHIKLHTSQRLVHCGVCNIQLPDSEAFEAHLRKIHKTDKLYKCKLCDHTVVDREAMIKHFQTHKEMFFYACPLCNCHFSGESGFEQHLKDAHGSVNLPSPGLKSVPMNSSLGGKTVGTSLPNIMCSECGFICSDQEAMQKHLWGHIKQNMTSGSTADVKVSTNEGSKENSMGVLKKNIDLGQKTLPKDVFYQCTSCAFTSSDNSIFVKHMLAHKTQEKHQKETISETSSSQGAKGNSDGSQTQLSVIDQAEKPSQMYTKVVTDKPESHSKSDNSVPFVYDKASARFRCLICNYHCEFQRTIKAHIWKHSGHQNIEYPMFDQSGNATSGSANVSSVTNIQQKNPQSDIAPEGQANTSTDKEKMRLVTLTSSQSQRPLQAFKTKSGDTVHLLPVDPSIASYKPGELIQIKDNTVIVPEKFGKTSAVSKFLESIVLAKENDAEKINDKQKEKGGNEMADANMKDSSDHLQKSIPGSGKVSIQTRSSSTLKGVSKAGSGCPSSKDSGNKRNKEAANTEAAASEGCTEPSVVVEVVDSIPPGYSLTGMKSQQGSPRVSDLDSSGGDSKFASQLRSAVLRSRDNSADSDTSASESENGRSGRGAEHKNPWTRVLVKSQQGHLSKFRCPFCDCQVTDDFKAHLMSCKAKNASGNIICDEKATDKMKTCRDELHHGSIKDEPLESLLVEDTDSTESSDETATGESSSSKKSGICSSLLAVIEQLRERSRSESEEDRLGGQISKKTGRKKGRQADLNLDSIDDLKNIEKINENGGDKFRCVLCHYTSERIYNIKLHMKTHRQKKPSECSLCEFSSTSPEALQEHMLKHCKVRTYACKYCPQSFNHKSTLRAHMRAHKDQEPYLCAYCVYETTSAQEYREHMQVHSGCSSRLRCPGCDLLLGGRDELTAHLLSCKGKSGHSRHSESGVDADCYKYERLLGDHASDVTNKVEFHDDNQQQQEIQPSTLTDATAITAADAEQPVQHSCVVQGCVFTSSSLKELQEHLSVHCNPSLLVCNLCDFKAWHSRSLKSHMKRHANDQRYVQQPLEQYKCNLCGYVCHHLPSLKSHMWRHASDQSYSYEFTNDVINAAIDHDNRVDAGGQADDPELLDQVINSERKILEGELTKCKRGDGQRPICWVTFRCCSCGFETINKAKLNIHMRTHSDLIQQAQAMDIIPRRKRSGAEERSQNQCNSPAKLIKTEN